MRRSSALRPLSAEHHQALLLAFQLRKSLEGHAEAAGAPPDVPGLVRLVRQFQERIFAPHASAEEELLGRHLSEGDMRRLKAEHGELTLHVQASRSGPPAGQRAALHAFAELLERHIRWEERELFPNAEATLAGDELAAIGGELERRLALAGQHAKGARR